MTLIDTILSKYISHLSYFTHSVLYTYTILYSLILIYTLYTPYTYTVIFSINFSDPMDKAMAKIFMQEFVESQRTVRTAPPVSYSKEAPLEITSKEIYTIVCIDPPVI